MRLAFVLFFHLVVILPFSAQTNRANTLLEDAQTMVQKRQYDDAIESLKKVERIFKSKGKKEARNNALLELSRTYLLSDDSYEAQKTAKRILRYTSSKDTLAASAHLILGEIEEGNSKYQAAIDFYEKSLTIRNNTFTENHPAIAESLRAIASAQFHLGQSDIAFENAQKAVDIYQSTYGVQNPATAVAMGTLGEIYAAQGEHQKAIENIQQGIEILKKELGEKQPTVIAQYFHLGEAYMAKGNYDLGLMNTQRGLTVLEEIKGIDNADRAPFLNNIGKIYALRGNYKQALIFYQQALELVQVFRSNHHADVATSFNNIAEIFQKQGQLDSALVYYKKSFEVNEILYGEDHPAIAENWSNIGTVYFKQKKYDQALAYYNNAFAKFEEFYGNPHISIAKVEQHIGETFLRKGGYELALDHLQKSLNANAPFAFETNDISQNPPLNEIIDKNIFLTTLALKAETLTNLYNAKGDFEKLKLSFQNFELCDSLIDDIRRSFIEYNDQLIFNRTASHVYEKAIYNCMILKNHTKDKKYLAQAFYYSEKNKSNTLLQSLSNEKAITFADVPDSLAAKEIVLKINISHAQKQLMNASQAKDSLKMTDAQERLLECKEAYNQFILRLEKDYPHYYQLKYDKSVASLEQVQNTLENGTTLVEFLSGEDQIFVFGVTASDAFIDIINKPSNYDSLIFSFRKSISDFKYINHSDSIEHAWNTYTTLSYELYQALLNEPLSHFPKRSFSNLIIIPDGKLGYIPFEILLQQKPTSESINYSGLDYLMNRYSISYAFSGTMLLEQREDERLTRALRYGGFAPEYSSGKLSLASRTNSYQYFRKGRYIDLPVSRKGVEEIAKLLEGDAFLGEMSTERMFKDTSYHYDILHLAMHGVYDDTNPLNSHLVFTKTGEEAEDNFLTAAELYSTNIDARMIFIGACNSGFGKINQGEGIMSLSRSFAYAGCPSIIMSLWSVPDEETANITNAFFQHIKNGDSKNEALRKAKIQYLNDSNTPPDRQHPLFWAGFVPIGDMTPLYAPNELSNNWTLLAAISMLVLTIFVGMIVWRKFIGKKE